MTVLQGSIQLLRKTEAEFAADNPVLLAGQIAISSDSTPPNKHKVGDGATAWSALSYATADTSAIEANIIQLQTDVTNIQTQIANFGNSTALVGNTWNGDLVYTELEADIDITLTTTKTAGFIAIRQNAIGGYDVTINGESIAVDSAALSWTIVQYNAVNGFYLFTTYANIVSAIIPEPDITAPTIVSVVANIVDNTITVTFDEGVFGTSAGYTFTRSAVPLTITSVTGDGTTAWVFAISETLTLTDVITYSYSSVTGDTVNAVPLPLASTSGSATINNAGPLSMENGFTLTGTSAFGSGVNNQEIIMTHAASKVTRAGTANAIKFYVKTISGTTTQYIFRVVRKTGGLYSQVGPNIVILKSACTANSFNQFTLPTPITVAVGDYIQWGYALGTSSGDFLGTVDPGSGNNVRYQTNLALLAQGFTNYDWDSKLTVTAYAEIQLIQL